jgi:putative RecB family exonuclease
MDSVLLKISPSSALDFKSCAQLFKFRTIDRLPEPVSRAAARGSLVHTVLERIFLDPPPERTPHHAENLLESLWEETRSEPETRPSDLAAAEEREWLDDARRMLRNYFRLEDPRMLQASRLEWWVEYELPEIHLRGIVDRVEERPDGSWILTDYKTGRVPGEARELAAFFGLRFYALVCWRAFGVIPREIRLVYLADPSVLTLNPNENMLIAFERQIQALARAINRAVDTGDWRPRPSPFCMSCSYHALCPAWQSDGGGEPSP